MPLFVNYEDNGVTRSNPIRIMQAFTFGFSMNTDPSNNNLNLTKTL